MARSQYSPARPYRPLQGTVTGVSDIGVGRRILHVEVDVGSTGRRRSIRAVAAGDPWYPGVIAQIGVGQRVEVARVDGMWSYLRTLPKVSAGDVTVGPAVIQVDEYSMELHPDATGGGINLGGPAAGISMDPRGIDITSGAAAVSVRDGHIAEAAGNWSFSTVEDPHPGVMAFARAGEDVGDLEHYLVAWREDTITLLPARLEYTVELTDWPSGGAEPNRTETAAQHRHDFPHTHKVSIGYRYTDPARDMDGKIVGSPNVAPIGAGGVNISYAAADGRHVLVPVRLIKALMAGETALADLKDMATLGAPHGKAGDINLDPADPGVQVSQVQADAFMLRGYVDAPGQVRVFCDITANPVVAANKPKWEERTAGHMIVEWRWSLIQPLRAGEESAPPAVGAPTSALGETLLLRVLGFDGAGVGEVTDRRLLAASAYPELGVPSGLVWALSGSSADVAEARGAGRRYRFQGSAPAVDVGKLDRGRSWMVLAEARLLDSADHIKPSPWSGIIIAGLRTKRFERWG